MRKQTLVTVLAATGLPEVLAHLRPLSLHNRRTRGGSSWSARSLGWLSHCASALRWHNQPRLWVHLLLGNFLYLERRHYFLLWFVALLLALRVFLMAGVRMWGVREPLLPALLSGDLWRPRWCTYLAFQIWVVVLDWWIELVWHKPWLWIERCALGFSFRVHVPAVLWIVTIVAVRAIRLIIGSVGIVKVQIHYLWCCFEFLFLQLILRCPIISSVAIAFIIVFLVRIRIIIRFSVVCLLWCLIAKVLFRMVGLKILVVISKLILRSIVEIPASTQELISLLIMFLIIV